LAAAVLTGAVALEGPAAGQPWIERADSAEGWAPPYVEHRSECELLNAGYGLPRCDLYGPAFSLYRRDEEAFYRRGYGDEREYGANPYSRGYGVEGRGWQLP
jgi:hypothetical protein